MKRQTAGYRVAVIGSSSLMGREILALLEERHFPVGQLLKPDDVPIDSGNGDTHGGELPEAQPRDALQGAPDFAFIASGGAKELRRLGDKTGLSASSGSKPIVIDLTGERADTAQRVLSIPFLDEGGEPSEDRGNFGSPHAAVIVLSTLLLRFGKAFPLERSVATIFCPASESGAAAIEELHKQTMNLLTFQKLPKEVFGTQMAFNLLPRLAGAAETGSEGLEARIRSELYRCLGGRVQLPAIRLVYIPAFYSLAVSLYMEASSTVLPEAVERALAGGRVRFHRAGEEAPSPVAAAGSSEILVDAAGADPGIPEGIWVWAVADNLRLAAENAVMIAEKLAETIKA